VWRQINPRVPPPRPDVRRIPPHPLVVAFLALVAFAALLGIWFERAGGD
jgi:putative membrane protein